MDKLERNFYNLTKFFILHKDEMKINLNKIEVMVISKACMSRCIVNFVKNCSLCILVESFDDNWSRLRGAFGRFFI